MAQELTEAIAAMRADEAVALARGMLDSGTDPLDIIAAGTEAMAAIGQRFSDGEAFLPELIMGGQIMKDITAAVMPNGVGSVQGDSKGTIVIGTVRGDIHDIGKDIVVLMLGIDGYTVHDLGTDVPVEEFVAAIRHYHADIVGLSGLLTLAFDSMKSTIDGIVAAGLREQVKIMVGGGPTDESVRLYTGADGWGNEVGQARRLVAQWTEERT
jgi:5-methyltetrahydrofolate--homocysteine methyltransferase